MLGGRTLMHKRRGGKKRHFSETNKSVDPIFIQYFVRFDKDAYAEYYFKTGTKPFHLVSAKAEASEGILKTIQISRRNEVVKMTTQTQERSNQAVATEKAVPWGKLPQVERIRVRQEIQRVCRSGGLHREALVLQIAEVLESQKDKHLDPLAVEAWEINVRKSSGVWGDSFKEGRISIRYNVACDIVNWLIAKKFLIDHGSDGIVICAGFPEKPAE